MKKLAALALALSLTLGLAVPTRAAGETFRDVPADHWGYADIEAAAQAGLMKGVGGGLFDPAGQVSAAQFLTLLGRLVFPEIQAQGADWSGPYVAAAEDGGLLDGTRVDPAYTQADVSRYDMAVILRAGARKLGVAEQAAQPGQVTDYGAIPEEYSGAVLAVYGMGLIQGDQTGNFNGNSVMTRAEVAAVIMRLARAAEANAGPAMAEGELPGALRYLLYRPGTVTPGMPLVIYLHGGSGKGDDLALLTRGEGFPQYLKDGMLGEVPAYVVMPQLPAEKRGWAEAADELFALIGRICEEYEIDPNQVSLTGHSMGGTGAWAIAAKEPELFSCVVPVSGSVKITPENVNALAGLPVRAFVGEDDTIVSPESSQRFVAALQRAGGDAEVTTLPRADHFSVPEAYLDSEYAILEWMLAQTRTLQ